MFRRVPLVKLGGKRLKFLQNHEACRLATASRQAVPHVVPVVYALDGDRIVIAVDYATKKLKNLRENPIASLVVDDYEPNRAVFILGDCQIIERGKEYLRLLKVLFERFEFYRKNPWGEGESPIIVITPTKVVSWGLR
jgi:nitroimidazol reductase NimA-like FMN-containing flavoprotein (pyridoxamine 5'-phosphate oxidase superfamily)